MLRVNDESEEFVYNRTNSYDQLYSVLRGRKLILLSLFQNEHEFHSGVWMKVHDENNEAFSKIQQVFLLCYS